MTDRAEGIAAIIASVLMLSSATFDPRISAGLSIVLLLGFAIERLGGRRAA